MTAIDIVQILGAMGTLILAGRTFLTIRSETDKTEAETDLIKVEALTKVNDSLTKEIEWAQKYAQRIKKEKDEEIAQLREQLQAERRDFNQQLALLRTECDKLQARIDEMEIQNNRR